MNITNILRNRFVCLSALMLLAVACTNDMTDSSGNLSAYEFREVEMPVAFDIESMISADPPTRSAENGDVDAELRVHDFWLIQFDSDGKRVTKPYYHRAADGEHVPMVVPVKKDVQFRCVVIANTNDPNLFNEGNIRSFDDIMSLPELEIRGGTLFRADRAFCVVENGKQYPLMCGETYVDYRTNKLGSVLRCYFAQVLLHFNFNTEKIRFEEYDISNIDFDNITEEELEELDKIWAELEQTTILRSIKVVNIPKKTYRYTGEMYHDPDMTESKDKKDYTFFEIYVSEDKSYEKLLQQLKENGSFDYVVYLPRRVKPDIGALTEVPIPLTGIQFEFADGEGNPVGYQTVNIVKTKDNGSYDDNKEILPRTRYDLTIEIKEFTNTNAGNGVFTDNRPDVPTNIYNNGYILSHANSFILNPEAETDNGIKLIDRHIKIPLSRIDQFYYLSAKNQYDANYLDTDIDRWEFYKLIENNDIKKVNPNPIPIDMLNNSQTKWTAEILWQDTPEKLIYFVDDEGNIDLNAMNNGGVEGRSIAFLDKSGNLRDGSNTVADNLNDGGFCFRLTGAKGNIVIGIRKTYDDDYYFATNYRHGYFPFYDDTLSGDKQYIWCFHLWITDYVPEGEVMDRNLGAMSTDDPGLYYYSNRKDPVPYTQLAGKQVYDHLGNTTSCIKIGGAPPSPDSYKINSGGYIIWSNGYSMYNSWTMLLARVEWAYYSLRHPLDFHSNSDGYWFNPEYVNDSFRQTTEDEKSKSIYDYLQFLWTRDGNNPQNRQYGNSVMLSQMELPMATEAINRKSLFDPCPPGWRLPEGSSDIQGHTRNMRGKYWTSTYNTPGIGYDGTPFKIKGKALNVNGGAVTESNENLATFLPVRCVRHEPKLKEE